MLSTSLQESKNDTLALATTKTGTTDTSLSPNMLVYCSYAANQITIYDMQQNKPIFSFTGVNPLVDSIYWSHVKEIPGTSYLVSLYHSLVHAGCEIYDISKKTSHKVFTYRHLKGGVGYGDIAVCQKKKLVAMIPSFDSRIAYQLVDYDNLRVCRRARWHDQFKGNTVDSFDVDPQENILMLIDENGICLGSELSSSKCLFSFDGVYFEKAVKLNRCRWSPVIGDTSIFIKYNRNKLNILDTTKMEQIFKSPIELDKKEYFDSIETYWIDCHKDGNLLASGGYDDAVKIFDRREGKIVKEFTDIHSSWIDCVRWHSDGIHLASACQDKTAKVIDIRTEKEVSVGATPDNDGVTSVCFI